MCGIAGLLTTDSTDHRPALQAAINLLKHRGPDDSGTTFFRIGRKKLTLGHTRLAILDLTKNGRQPMATPDLRYTLTYNGEIYNYVELRAKLESLGYIFNTKSDTEVLLCAWVEWGVESLAKMVGMFAFAVYDRKENTLHLVRDNFGIKPLYYHTDSDPQKPLAFASEIPALLALLGRPPELNYQRACSYLLNGLYENSNDTFFKNIHHVPPGSYICIDVEGKKKHEPVRWWWPEIRQTCELTFDEAAEKLRSLFLDSIRVHMRSDVKIGATLSGGLDSAAICCAMRHLEPDLPIHTFTFSSSNACHNEEKWADCINHWIKATTHKVLLSPKNLWDDLVPLILAQGEPFTSTSVYAQNQVFAAARQEGIIVVLEGQGADEIMAGYDGYPGARMRSMLSGGQFFSAAGFLYSWAGWPGRSLRRMIAAVVRGTLPPRYLKDVAYKRDKRSSPWVDTAWFERNSDFDVDAMYDLSVTCNDEQSSRTLVATLRNAVTRLGLPALLRHGDRNSMYSSIESRVPFLNHQIVEYLFSLPESYLIGNNGETKRIFRAAMRSIVPDKVLDRKDKIGFETPERDWLADTKLTYGEIIPVLGTIPFLRISEDDLRSGAHDTKRLWRLINFCKWFEVFQPRI